MRWPRFRLRSLMQFVIGVAVLLAPVCNPTVGWSILLPPLLCVALLASVLGSIFRRGKKRVFWVGFAVFGFAFTSVALHFFERSCLFGIVDAWTESISELISFPFRLLWDEQIRLSELMKPMGKARMNESVEMIGVPIMVALFAILGGWIARFFAHNPEPVNPVPGESASQARSQIPL